MNREVVIDEDVGAVREHAPVRVLLADDTADLRGLMRAMLEASGGFVIVGEAADGAEAVRLAEAHQPDLAVVDVAMPVMGGLQAIPRIKTLSPGTRIAVLTVFELRDLEAQATAAGADVCLDKTRPPAELVASLAELAGARVDAVSPRAGEAWATGALRESQAGFTEAFDVAAIGMALTDFDGRPLRVNAALARILSRSPEELAMCGLWQWGAIRQPPHPWDGSLKTSGAPVQVEQMWLKPDGSPVWVTVDAAPVQDKNGRPLYLFCQIQDVTDRHRAEDALRESEARFRGAWEASPNGMSLVSVTGTLLMVNRRLCEMSGYDEEELIGQRFSFLSHPDDVEIGQAEVLDCLEGRADRWQVDKRYVRRNGTAFWVMISGTVVRADNGQALFLASEIHDLTERLADRHALHESEERFRQLAEHSSDLIGRYEPRTGAIRYVSPSCRTILGYEVDEMIGTSWADYMGPEDMAVVPTIDDAAEDDVFTVSVRAKDGRSVWLEVSRVFIRDPSSGRLLDVQTSARDVTDRVGLQARLTELALHDSLTGLANRVVLMDRLEHALARRALSRTPLAVLFVDLDHFKEVNDTCGHAVGDIVLVEVAERLRRILRPADTASRLGGDEFVVVCEDLADGAEAIAVAERIEEALSMPHHVAGEHFEITASVGIAMADTPTTAAAILKRADAAMYEAKDAGRACFRVAT